MQETDKVKNIFQNVLKEHNKYISTHISMIDKDCSNDELTAYEKEWEKQKYAYNGAYKLYLQGIVNKEFANTFNFGYYVNELSSIICNETCSRLSKTKDPETVTIRSIVNDIDSRLLWNESILTNLKPEFIRDSKEFAIVHECNFIRTSYIYDLVVARYKFFMYGDVLHYESTAGGR